MDMVRGMQYRRASIGNHQSLAAFEYVEMKYISHCRL